MGTSKKNDLNCGVKDKIIMKDNVPTCGNSGIKFSK